VGTVYNMEEFSRNRGTPEMEEVPSRKWRILDLFEES
jgi:hypothetical protein